MAVNNSAVQQSGGDFTTLTAWEADRDGNSGAGDTENANITGTWSVDDANSFTISGFAASVIINIVATGDSKHTGKIEASPTYYRLAGASGHVITCDDSDITLEGFVIRQDATSSSSEGVRINSTATGLILNDLIIHANTASSTDQDGCYTGSGTSVTATFTNCIIFNWGRGCIHNQSGTPTLNVNSCTVMYGGQEAAAAADRGCLSNTGSAVWAVFNTIAMNSGANADFNFYSNPTTANLDYCVASDTSISTEDAGAVGALESRTSTDTASPGAGDWVIFTDDTTSPYDFTLQDNATDNDAQEAHSSSTGAGLTIPSEDILDGTRDAAYDMGAHEVSVAGGVFTYQSSGKILGKGVAATAVAFSYAGTGKALAKGSAVTVVAFSYAGTGKALAKGAISGTQTTGIYAGTGKAIAKGVAGSQVTVIVAGTGKALLKGVAATTNLASFSYSGTGKALLTGAGGATVSLSYLGNGKALLKGVAATSGPTSGVFSYTGDGLSLVSGAATTTVAFSYAADGTLLASGVGGAELAFSFAADGTLLAKGVGGSAITLSYAGTGRSLVRGTSTSVATVTVVATATGKALVSGTAATVAPTVVLDLINGTSLITTVINGTSLLTTKVGGSSLITTKVSGKSIVR